MPATDDKDRACLPQQSHQQFICNCVQTQKIEVADQTQAISTCPNCHHQTLPNTGQNIMACINRERDLSTGLTANCYGKAPINFRSAVI